MNTLSVVIQNNITIGELAMTDFFLCFKLVGLVMLIYNLILILRLLTKVGN
ncbi:hypothetical protein G9F70_003825 [Clostridium sp. FP1]|nr:hypothetical protein [Clostridium sp. FP1]MBZ9633407.1 hypothetical protein [Clostridium sp. FP1]